MNEPVYSSNSRRCMGSLTYEYVTRCLAEDFWSLMKKE